MEQTMSMDCNIVLELIEPQVVNRESVARLLEGLYRHRFITFQHGDVVIHGEGEEGRRGNVKPSSLGEAQDWLAQWAGTSLEMSFDYRAGPFAGDVRIDNRLTEFVEDYYRCEERAAGEVEYGGGLDLYCPGGFSFWSGEAAEGEDEAGPEAVLILAGGEGVVEEDQSELIFHCLQAESEAFREILDIVGDAFGCEVRMAIDYL